MQSRLNPYISFKDNAREAMEFYKSVFGGNLTLNTYGDSGMPPEAGDGTKLIHAMLEADNGITFMASDAPAGTEEMAGTNISMSLSGDNEEELTTYYNKLSEGGTIGEPLMKAPWGDTFGVFIDKFGVNWMVNISGKNQE